MQGLRECVAAHPTSRNCASCTAWRSAWTFKVQDAIEELREGVRLAPDSFIAQLKMGELWMRLRVIEKAEEHTHQAALLARNMVQSELARRQAATIRTYVHNGVKRGGYSYKGPWHLVTTLRKLWKRDRRKVKPWRPRKLNSHAARFSISVDLWRSSSGQQHMRDLTV